MSCHIYTHINSFQNFQKYVIYTYEYSYQNFYIHIYVFLSEFVYIYMYIFPEFLPVRGVKTSTVSCPYIYTHIHSFQNTQKYIIYTYIYSFQNFYIHIYIPFLSESVYVYIHIFLSKFLPVRGVLTSAVPCPALGPPPCGVPNFVKRALRVRQETY